MVSRSSNETGFARREILAAGAAGLAVLASSRVKAGDAVAGPVIETTGGKVRGLSAGGVQSFKDIPFLGDTGGRMRFKPAPPAPKWASVRDATGYGPGFPQATPFGPAFAPVKMSEDALNLNVWTPGARRGAKRPVLVWIFGGGFVAGSGTDTEYDGTYLAARGDVVVVTFNYRVGVFGGLYLGGISTDYVQGNMMFRDQVAALTWVRDNIDSFGGDPSNITIFGQSAGGHSCGDLLAVPQARGLFHKCSPQSGADFRVHTKAEAEEFADRFLHALGLTRQNWQAIFDVPADQLVAKTGLGNVTSMWKEAFAGLSTRPMIDGDTLKSQPHLAVAGGSADGIPLLIGTNEFELSAWARSSPIQMSLDDFKTYVRERPLVATNAERMIEVYGQRGDAAPQQMENFMRDLVFGIPATRMAQAQGGASSAPVYSYLFTWQSPVPGMRSAHHMQVPFEFGTIDLAKQAPVIGRGPGRKELAEKFSGAMIAFARTGNPSHDGIPRWPTYSSAGRQTMIIDNEWHIASDPMAERRRAWDGVVYGSLSET